MRNPDLYKGATLPVSLGSLGAFAGQAVLALTLVRYYSPESVGQFSVWAQVGFAWAALALAQAPISLLANNTEVPASAVTRAFRESLRRWWMLMPVAAMAGLWMMRAGPQLQHPWVTVVVLALATAAMSCLQAGWMLAQSIQLRWGSAAAIAMVRLVPPWAAALIAVGAAHLQQASTLALLAACSAGFALGCLGIWLRAEPGAQAGGEDKPDPALAEQEGWQGDPRTGRLKMSHTLSDLAVSTVLALQWAVLYGAADAGFLLLALRVLALVPTLVSVGWSQGILSRPSARRPSLMVIICLALLSLTGLAGLAQILASMGWLGSGWEGLQRYILAVAVWQGSAVLVAAVAYRPFLAHRPSAPTYSRMCIGSNLMQLVAIVVPPAFGFDQASHLWLFVATVTALQAALAGWAASLNLRS